MASPLALAIHDALAQVSAFRTGKARAQDPGRSRRSSRPPCAGAAATSSVSDALAHAAEHDFDSALILSDLLEERGDLAGAAALRDGDLTPARRLQASKPWPAQPRAKLTSLSAAEKARMPEYAERWTRIGLRSGPTTESDKERFRRAIAIVYGALQPIPLSPPHVVWVTSPIAGCIVGAVAPFLRAHGTGVTTTTVRNGLIDLLELRLMARFETVVEDFDLADDVVVGVTGRVEEAVYSGVADDVFRALMAAFIAAKPREDSLPIELAISKAWGLSYGAQTSVGSASDSRAAPASMSYLQDVCGLTLGPDADRIARAHQTICETSYQFWPGEDLVVAAPRPILLERDATGRLSRATWADGWDVTLHEDRAHWSGEVQWNGRGNVDVGELLREVLPPIERAGV